MIVELPVPWDDLRVSIPLDIGTVPLRQLFQSFLPPKEVQDDSPSIPGVPYPNFRKNNMFELFFKEYELSFSKIRLSN